MGSRQLKTAVTMLALVGILVLGASWGWKALFAEVPGVGLTAGEPGPSCTPEQVKSGQKIQARQIQVSVFNGGTRSGLAGETLDALQRRGFVSGDVGNAPVKARRVKVWTTTKNDPAARLVAMQFGPGVKVKVTKRDLGSGVDVIVGNDFQRLSPAPRALKVGKQQDLCVPVATPTPID